MDEHDFPPTIYTEWAVGVTPASNHIPFGIDASGTARDASAVENGLKCGCCCPSCGGELVARQGEVRADHFAHHSKRECRHALEASLFRATVAALGDPGLVLRVPGVGDRRRLAAFHRVHLEERAARIFFATPWVVDPETIEGVRVEVVVADLADSVADRADLLFPDLGIRVHLLSHRKDAAQVRAAFGDEPGRVLGLDLRFYASLWWDTCERDREAKTVSATASLWRWLRDDEMGKGWLSHPEFEAKAASIREWAKRHPLPAPAPPPRPVHYRMPRVPEPSATVPVALPVASCVNEEDRPDQILRRNVDSCRLCGMPMNEIIFGSGEHAGRRAIACVHYWKHDFKLLD